MNLLSLIFSENAKEAFLSLGDSHSLKHTIFPRLRDFILYSLLDPSPDISFSCQIVGETDRFSGDKRSIRNTLKELY